jgi:hypothetical protein
MFDLRIIQTDALFALKWVARILAAVCLVILLLFIFSSDFEPSLITISQVMGMVFFPVGLMVGLALGWKNELAGGLVGIGSVALFYLTYGLLINGSMALGFWFLVFAIPAALFVIHGLISTLHNRSLFGGVRR